MTDKKTTEDTTEVVAMTDGRKVTWSYEKKVSDGHFGSEGFSVFITDHCPEDEPSVLAWADTYAPTVANTIRPLVWEALGLEYGFDTNGVPGLIEQAPPAPVAPAPPPPPQPQPQQVRAGGPPPQPQPRQAPQQQPTFAQYGVYAPQPQFCKECGGTDFYDNRADVDANILAGKAIGPDWKCKNPNCAKPRVYRPGSYPYNEALKGGGPPPPPATTPPVAMSTAAPHPFPPMHVPPEQELTEAPAEEPF